MMPRLFVCLYFFYILNVFIGKFNEMEVNGRRVGWNILIIIYHACTIRLCTGMNNENELEQR